MLRINRISPDQSAYLQMLTHIAQPVKSLYFIGRLPEARCPTVAIVGSRKMTTYGKEVAYQFAYELARRGVIIISGLAIGIDAVAHQAALDAGGTTIAVLGHGLPEIYPIRNRRLADDIIASGGAILSEYEPYMPAMRHQFVERNRIESGLSNVVLIVESAMRSGTLSTARFALEQGKDVAAIPGNITNPMSAGCNALIQNGAVPATSVDDLLRLLNLPNDVPGRVQAAAHTAEEAVLLQLLTSGIRDGDELHMRSQFDTATFNQTLTMLELSGTIRALGANQWTVS